MFLMNNINNNFVCFLLFFYSISKINSISDVLVIEECMITLTNEYLIELQCYLMQ